MGRASRVVGLAAKSAKVAKLELVRLERGNIAHAFGTMLTHGIPRIPRIEPKRLPGGITLVGPGVTRCREHGNTRRLFVLCTHTELVRRELYRGAQERSARPPIVLDNPHVA